MKKKPRCKRGWGLMAARGQLAMVRAQCEAVRRTFLNSNRTLPTTLMNRLTMIELVAGECDDIVKGEINASKQSNR